MLRPLPLLLLLTLSGTACTDPSKSPPPPAEPSAPTAIAPATSSAAVPAASAAPAKPAQPRVDRVVLLTIDATRGDQPWTGYTRVKTPNLSKFAEQSVVYTRSYSIANTTGPSISALLAVRYPTELERDNCPLAGFTVGQGIGPTLHDGGVWTGAAHGHAYFGTPTSPRGGFVDWRTVENVAGRLATEGAVTGPDVTKLALALLTDAPTDKPSFIWAHYLEPHDTYVFHKDFPPSGEPRRGVYDGEVAFADFLVGQVIDAIDASPMKDRTAIIVTSDHGEAFGEHERYRHGFTVYEEEVHVPLLIRIPGMKPRRIDIPRSAMDLPPTIAALLGVTPPAHWRGQSLLPDLATESPVERPVIVDVPELMNLPDQQVVLFGNHKVIRLGSRWTVYDLAADPKEKRPMAHKDAKPFVEKAKSVLSAIETVPHKACKGQPYRTPKGK